MCRCRRRQYVAGIIRSPAAYYDERYYLSTPSSSSSSSRRVTRNTERDQWQRNSSSSGWRRHGGWAGDEQRWVGVAVSSCRTMHVRSAKTNDDVNGHALSHVHTLTYSPTTGALKAVETRLVSSRCDVESSPDQSGRWRYMSILRCTNNTGVIVLLFCALSLATQCIVIGPVCLQRAGGRTGVVFVSLWVCYHDNSKLRASIFTKLGL